MNADIFAAFTRRAAAGISRRSSLLVLGGTTLAALTRPMTAQAANAGKKARKKCKKQGGACREFVLENCANVPNPALCIEILNSCCALLSDCKAAAFFTCLEESAL